MVGFIFNIKLTNFKTMEKIAIHESATSEKVLRFEPLDSFTKEFQDAYNNNMIYGVLEENGKLKATDIYGETHENITY